MRRIRAVLLAFLHPELVGATKDPLTGVLSRQGFTDAAERELSRAQRSQRSLTLVFIDLDKVKQINDTQGHAAGDLHLKRFSKIVESSIRPYDVFARWGGDEFVLLLPDTNLADARRVVGRIHSLFPDFSWGVSCWLGGEDKLEGLVGRADAEMYVMKAEKRR